ncbi:hypothetical protein B0T10DRAFT_603825 [Thelonectria olida]|uniref:Uncharacterized protein n=1 Tax=Thelonectria olida TaxID=1576542 RepID=A0A9P8W9S4_9HYPO|nr:hypothetical protein B0T10DRAFT_603825 [Thelonectria olida]
MMSSSPIIDRYDLAALQREGTIITSRSGTSSIHKRRLNSSSEQEYEGIPLPTPPSSSPDRSGLGAKLLDHYITIPEDLISRETLLFMGFTEPAATEIWSRWTACDPAERIRETDGGLVTFESMARAYIHSGAWEASDDDDDSWRVRMNSCGINQELQRAVMTPRCKNVRLTESCKFWLLDTISARYASLKQIQAASRERGRAARREATRPEPSQPSAGQPMPRRQSTSEMLYASPNMSMRSTTDAEVRANAPGHTVLYRGGYETAIKTIFNPDGGIHNMVNIFSGRQGDFNATKLASYFAMDFEVAEQYAYYAKRRDQSQLTVVLRIEIPNSALDGLTETEKCFAYWPSPGWKKLVWLCRRRVRLQHEMARFARAKLVIGTICGEPNAVENLNTPEDITHDMVFQGPRGDAVQYTFIDDQGIEFLENHASSCKMYPMTLSAVEEMEG